MMKFSKLTTVGVSVALGACILAGCGGGGDKKEDKKADNAASGKVLKFGVTNFADSLDPTDNFFGWVVMRYGIGETLTKFDGKMRITPWIAKGWKMADDKVTWTFDIDEKAKFSNGKPVTAEAVKKSIERAFAKSKRAATFFKYTEIKAEGQKLTIVTDKPYPNMCGFLADPLFLIIDTDSEKERDFKKQGPIGTGPYTVKSFVKEKAVMERNKNYWNGEVPYDVVEIPSIDDPNTRAMALQSGEIDMAVNIAAGDIGLFNDTKKFHIDRIASLRTVNARINQREGRILRDPKVRAALICCTDRKTYNEVLLKGTFIEGKAPVPPSLDFGFDQLKDPNAYNPERAKKLLDEAGWKMGADGIREKDGKKCEIDIVTYNSRAELPLYSEAIQADAKKVGIKVNVKSVDYNLVDKMGINGEFDLIMVNTNTANTGDPAVYLGWYWKTNNDGDNPQNGAGYSNAKVDALLDQLASEFDPAKRRELTIQVQQLLMDDGAGYWAGYPETNLISSTKITGAIMHPSDYYWVTKDIKPAK